MSHHLLLIKDDPTEAELAKLYLQRLAPDLAVTHLTDGRAFLEYCLGDPPPGVSLAILDLQLHAMGGLATLEALREKKQRLPYPILILSPSTDPGQISRAYELGASGFVTKSVGSEEYRKVLKHILDFWISTNRVA